MKREKASRGGCGSGARPRRRSKAARVGGTAGEPEGPAAQGRLRRILDRAGDAIYVHDRAGRLLDVNQQACDALGYTRGELLKLTVADVTADFDPRMYEQVHRELARKRTVHVEGVHRRKDGTRLAVEIMVSLLAEDGRELVVAVARDITRRKQTEQELARARDRLEERVQERTAELLRANEALEREIARRKRAQEQVQKSQAWCGALIDHGASVYAVLDGEGIVLYESPSLERVYGWRTEEILGRSIFEQVHPEDAGRAREGFQEVLDNPGVARTAELRYRHKDGSWRVIDVAGVNLLGDPAVRGVVLTSHDVTEHKHAEDELRKFKAISDQAGYGTAIYDPDGNLIYINEAFAAMHGYSAEEMIGRHLSVFCGGQPLAGMRRLGERLRREGSFTAKEVMHRRRDGSLVPTLMSATVLHGDDGQPLYLAATALDITERKQSDTALREAHRQLMLAREAERRSLARELHDSLGQQLVALNLALRKGTAACRTGQRDEAVQAFTRAGEACGELIQEVRNLSHGLYPPALESLGLAAAVKQLARRLDTPMSVAVRCSRSTQRARFRPEQEIAVFRIVQEAVNNALRHSRGEVINVRLGCRNKRLVARVIDDGAGFDMAEVAHRGLGLRTMRERAEALGGELRASSRPGRTEIRVEIPVDG